MASEPSNRALKRIAPTPVALEGWVTETLVKLNADDRADVRTALRTLGMKIVLPTLLLDLPLMAARERIALFKAMTQMGLATGGKEDGTEVETARVVYVLPD